MQVLWHAEFLCSDEYINSVLLGFSKNAFKIKPEFHVPMHLYLRLNENIYIQENFYYKHKQYNLTFSGIDDTLHFVSKRFNLFCLSKI